MIAPLVSENFRNFGAMKIVHVIFQMLTGGAETMLVDIANEQTSRGHEVEILIVNRGEDANVVGALLPAVRVVRFNRKQGAAPLLLMARLNLYMLRSRPDIVHLHLHKLTGLLRVMRSCTLFTVHDLNVPMTYAARSNMAAISDAVADDVRSRVAGAKISVVTNGINTEAVRPRPAGGLHSPARIVQVSRLVSDKKGQDILIEAVAILRGRGYEVEATFIGGGRDLKKLRRLAETKGVADAVRFTGNMPRREIYAQLADYDLMCHPARFEGFGLTVAEGMAAGLPLVVPQGGGPWEVADCGRLCETFDNGDALSCADAIARVLDNYDKALNLAVSAREHVEAQYSVKRMVTDYEAIYRRLLGARN